MSVLVERVSKLLLDLLRLIDCSFLCGLRGQPPGIFGGHRLGSWGSDWLLNDLGFSVSGGHPPLLVGMGLHLVGSPDGLDAEQASHAIADHVS